MPGQDLAPAPDHRQDPATPLEPEIQDRQSHIIPGEVVTIDQSLQGDFLRGGTDLGHRSLLVFREDARQDLTVDMLTEGTDPDRRRLLVLREDARQDLPVDMLTEGTDLGHTSLLVFREEARQDLPELLRPLTSFQSSSVRWVPVVPRASQWLMLVLRGNTSVRSATL